MTAMAAVVGAASLILPRSLAALGRCSQAGRSPRGSPSPHRLATPQSVARRPGLAATEMPSRMLTCRTVSVEAHCAPLESCVRHQAIACEADQCHRLRSQLQPPVLCRRNFGPVAQILRRPSSPPPTWQRCRLGTKVLAATTAEVVPRVEAEPLQMAAQNQTVALLAAATPALHLVHATEITAAVAERVLEAQLRQVTTANLTVIILPEAPWAATFAIVTPANSVSPQPQEVPGLPVPSRQPLGIKPQLCCHLVDPAA